MSAQKAYKDTKEKDTSKVINFATSNTDWTSALQPAAGAASSSPDAVGEDLHRPGEGPINELVSNWWLLIFVPLVLLFLILLLFLFLLLRLFLLLCRTNIMFWPFCRSLCFFQLSGAVLVLLGTVLFLCVCVWLCVFHAVEFLRRTGSLKLRKNLYRISKNSTSDRHENPGTSPRRMWKKLSLSISTSSGKNPADWCRLSILF